jgi:phage shock protein PspC (stress-responsive transcriptional regulator)
MSGEYRKLYRSRKQRMLAGVAGGLGEYFGIDPTLVRLIWVVAGLFGGPLALVAYFIFMIVVPDEPLASTSVVDASASEPPESAG